MLRGSGKSIAISLLQRFYDPNVGHILLDGVDIQKFQLRWLRQQMGLVSQEPALFNDTIRANIAYGKQGEVIESDIVCAAQLVNAHKFISSLHQVKFKFSSPSIIETWCSCFPTENVSPEETKCRDMEPWSGSVELSYHINLRLCMLDGVGSKSLAQAKRCDSLVHD
ncbi:hypothetical protein OsI_18506 [Oryza sativa Indica Group]|uniref:ABC transporter domain-containing protein n=1 Tax=Oryza sativa subsp. indica TaxID=39946 RepID=B8AY63_ORYSI|nr:hypothetical protein OsI_18506 [Oryza sativa Indica Group]